MGARGGYKYKIGCTTSVMQQYLKIAHPCAGGLFSGRIHQGHANLNHGGYFRPGIECEIAVRLGRDLSPTDAPFTADKVAEAVESYMPAIEVVDERYGDWPHTEAPTLIADDFFAAGCVLGASTPRLALPDLAQLTGQTFINGVEAARGVGADVMGHPHNALAWLANNLAGRGKALRAGEIVLTGSLVQTQWPAPQDEVVGEHFWAWNGEPDLQQRRSDCSMTRHIDPPLHKPVRLELAQLVRQHAVRHARAAGGGSG